MPLFKFEGTKYFKSTIDAPNLAEAVRFLRKRHKTANYGMEVVYTEDAIRHEHAINGFCDACNEPLIDEDWKYGEDCSLCSKCCKEYEEAA
jgi:formylmethanofuran dehydrogenase subunit E